MKLAISNIAWKKHNDPQIFNILRKYGVSGIEIAPTKIWRNWEKATHQSAKEYRHQMNSEGFEVPALQAILYGKPELQVFDKSSHTAFYEHVKRVSELANGLNCKIIIFGSPKNRKRGQLPYNEAIKIAEDFFYNIGEISLNQNCCIGLEHNPVEYGCDFITNVLDAKKIVENVNSEGFKLHVDSAGLNMCGGNEVDILKKAGEFIHYHISEPMLKPISKDIINHVKIIKYLKEINYNRWVSIEMTCDDNISILEKSVNKIAKMLHV